MIGVNDDYTVEITCTYKGEKYRVRDNGAVYRLQKGKRKRQYDGYWTFGLQHPENGYMYISQERVHRIVATAFHGEPKDKNLVVDHIDTNRANNRPDNLRWVTRLENALNNPITRAKIIYICGSIQKFLDNPSILRTTNVSDKNFRWMRAVSREEAKVSKERLEEWAKETPEELKDKVERSGEGIDEWVFTPKSGQRHIANNSDEQKLSEKHFQSSGQLLQPLPKKEEQTIDTTYSETPPELSPEQDHEASIQDDSSSIQPEYKITDSLTANAKQVDWHTPAEFPYCPENLSIEEYYNNIRIGGIFSKNDFKTGVVIDKEWLDKGRSFVVLAKDEKAFFPWMPTPVLIKDGSFLHFNCGTYHLESIARKEILKMKGEKVEYTDEENEDMDIF